MLKWVRDPISTFVSTRADAKAQILPNFRVYCQQLGN